MKWIKTLFHRKLEKIKPELPNSFDSITMLRFTDNVINEQQTTQCKKIYFNFSTLVSIDPVGVVVLSNLIDYFDKIKIDVVFEGFETPSDANFFLDQTGFFKHHLKEKYQLKEKYKQKRIKSNQRCFSYKNPELVSSDNAISLFRFNALD
jgi:hypothetical protein